MGNAERAGVLERLKRARLGASNGFDGLVCGKNAYAHVVHVFSSHFRLFVFFYFFNDFASREFWLLWIQVFAG